MLSLFLESPEIFTQEFIIDELMDFFLAGTLTTHYTSQTALTHFAHNQESLKKARDEFRKAAEENFPDEIYSIGEQAYLDQTVKLEVI